MLNTTMPAPTIQPAGAVPTSATPMVVSASPADTLGQEIPVLAGRRSVHR